jgi:hypothetical protein
VIFVPNLARAIQPGDWLTLAQGHGLEWLDSVCDLYSTIPPVSNGFGGSDETITLRSEHIPCRIQRDNVGVSQREGDVSGQTRATTEWVLRLPTETTVLATDKIHIFDAHGRDMGYWEISGQDTHRSEEFWLTLWVAKIN